MKPDLASVVIELLAGIVGLGFCWLLGARRAAIALFWASCLIVIRRIAQENLTDGVAGSIFPMLAGRWMLYSISALKVYAGVEGIVYVGTYILPLLALLEEADHEAVGHCRTAQGHRSRWHDRLSRCRLFRGRGAAREGADRLVASSVDARAHDPTAQPTRGRAGEDLRGGSGGASDGIEHGPTGDPQPAPGAGRTRSPDRRAARRPAGVRTKVAAAVGPAILTLALVGAGWWIADVKTEIDQVKTDNARLDTIAREANAAAIRIAATQLEEFDQ